MMLQLECCKNVFALIIVVNVQTPILLTIFVLMDCLIVPTLYI